jgi:hypothetical protein
VQPACLASKSSQNSRDAVNLKTNYPANHTTRSANSHTSLLFEGLILRITRRLFRVLKAVSANSGLWNIWLADCSVRSEELRRPDSLKAMGFFEMMEGEMQKKSVSISKDDQTGDVAARARFRAVIFTSGDWLFLIFTGMAATLAMHVVHSLDWHLAFVLPVGMVIAMLIQILLAKAVAPVLGSIESMVSSMIVAMFVPMLVCLSSFVGVGMSSWAAPLSLGALGGTGLFLLLKLYEYRYKKFLRRTFPRERGG